MTVVQNHQGGRLLEFFTSHFLYKFHFRVTEQRRETDRFTEGERERGAELSCGMLTWATFCQSRGARAARHGRPHTHSCSTLVGSPD